MKVGIISDTHDNIYAVREAVEVFNSREVSMVLHAGDIVSPFVIKEFKNLHSPISFIFGNNEGEINHLKDIIYEMNFIFSGRFYQNTIEDKKVVMVHGDIPIVNSLIKSKMFDIIISGHTHRRLIERFDKVIHINPGEACGYLTGIKSISILDTKKMDADFIEL